MNNALNQPQTIVVLGGGSEIAHAIVRALASPALRVVVLAARAPESVEIDGVADGVVVDRVTFDATDHEGHAALIDALAARHGDLDVVVQAFGQLGTSVGEDPAEAARLIDVNTTGAVSSGLGVAAQLRRQGHGALVVLSSVAGVRTRASNFVYGASKAGQDAFATGLGHALHGSGARVLTVRPGFVRSQMTEGMPEAPFSVDPDDVAAAVAKGLVRRQPVVWVPGLLRFVFGVLRYAPGFVWRKIDR